MASAQFAVNQLASCQFGNPGDTRGYATEVPVIVVAVKGDSYLVKKVDEKYFSSTEGYYGVAYPNNDPEDVKGQLYCTMAKSSITEEQAKNIFGF